MTTNQIESRYLEALLTELEQPQEPDLLQMSGEVNHLIEREIELLERSFPSHWRQQ